MKPKHSAFCICIGVFAIVVFLVCSLSGCAQHPVNAPSTAAVNGDIQQAKTATQATQESIQKFRDGTDKEAFKASRAIQYF